MKRSFLQAEVNRIAQVAEDEIRRKEEELLQYTNDAHSPDDDDEAAAAAVELVGNGSRATCIDSIRQCTCHVSRPTRQQTMTPVANAPRQHRMGSLPAVLPVHMQPTIRTLLELFTHEHALCSA